jgi:(E)-4-hydroxy-3-methylbut-2-enyl-diphosphate synthase
MLSYFFFYFLKAISDKGKMVPMMKKYCVSIARTLRWKTREVRVGSIGIGGDQPVRIQSMTTTNTRDVLATIEQIMRLSDQGCELARVTVQGKKEAQSCEAIKNGLLQKGYTIPLIADIHFYPPAALLVAEFVDKVRINPGNFADQRALFKTIEYDDESYARELAHIEEVFSPLVEKCKRLGKAMRLGANHGSLSDRIMNRYGDSPSGMVESALEYARVCRSLDYHNFLFSMKASNPVVMIEAYRLLVAKMMELGWNYPLHLGVTEAGEGEDGRIKSAMGIGALFMDGLGDTIRVSLTEDPWCEIEPCRKLVSLYEKRLGSGIEPFEERYQEHPVRSPLGKVIMKVHASEIEREGFLADLGCRREGEGIFKEIDAPDALWFDAIPDHPMIELLRASGMVVFDTFCPSEYILLHPKVSILHETRRSVSEFRERNLQMPVILCLSEEDLICLAVDAGSVFCDSLADGICLLSNTPLLERRKLSFALLQSARMRMTKTDYISCPGCGRTLFDLQEVSRRIRGRTAHLAGVKIAIMGCIVNGLGEMADADFGYVGSKPGMIDLYVGKTCVERNIPHAEADRKLIQLIAAHGKWKEPHE